MKRTALAVPFFVVPLLWSCGGPPGPVDVASTPAQVLVDPDVGTPIGYVSPMNRTYVFDDGVEVPTARIDTRHWSEMTAPRHAYTGHMPLLCPPVVTPTLPPGVTVPVPADEAPPPPTAHGVPGLEMTGPNHTCTARPPAPPVVGIEGVGVDVVRCWQTTYGTQDGAMFCQGCCVDGLCEEDCVDLRPQSDVAAMYEAGRLDPIPADLPGM